ncbi:hypothetical protein BGZ61DRAFT_485760 [Ilyonectria robusta]|uniref:uncharacterized protein n=1 Tax=Ilyonectria robusta TaxID=1079257 RepID=UPI001E8D0ED8|nr:uncharacterized protein BGZ61DRAFT_485760 [Ilyonectria robusta]KAH8659563.1 hypothetical protein BGZ61DRAFT_485760 [Ilyonectria robusta]
MSDNNRGHFQSVSRFWLCLCKSYAVWVEKDNHGPPHVSGISDAAATDIVPTDVPNIPIRDGFEVALLNPRPDPKRFADREWVTGDFYMRAGEIVLEKTGARDARVLEHQNQVHADQTSAAGWARLKTLWPEVASDQVGTVRHDRDFQSSNVVPADRIGESYMAYHHPEHSWYFLSEQAGDEAWVFMSWDSDPHAPQRKCSEQELPSKKQVQNLTIASW